MCNISIIIPVYNASSFLHKCMESILTQSVTDIEIILINDGSKDNSLEICKRYAPNGGVSSARNHGIERASGEYLMFVDSDDWLAPDALETCMPYIPEYDIVRFSASAIYPNKERKYKLGRSDDRKKILKDIVARKTIVACWGGLFRKKLSRGCALVEEAVQKVIVDLVIHRKAAPALHAAHAAVGAFLGDGHLIEGGGKEQGSVKNQFCDFQFAQIGLHHGKNRVCQLVQLPQV